MTAATHAFALALALIGPVPPAAVRAGPVGGVPTDVPPADTVPVQRTAAAPSLTDDLAMGAGLAVHGLSAPVRWSPEQWATLPVAFTVLVALGGIDDDVTRLARENRGSIADAYFEVVEPLGLEASFVVLGGMYAGGWLLDRPGLRRTAVEAGAASAVAFGVVVPVLKAAIGRHRPEEKDGPDRFEPFSGHYSFPSGHTTQAFALASVIAAESPHRAVDLLAYGLAASVGGARIYHDAHFLTDVLAGAALGTVVGRTMARKGRALREVEPVVEVMPDGRPALGVSIGF